MVHAPERATAGGVDVTVSGDLAHAVAIDEAVASNVKDKVPSRITASDPTLWGPDAEAEAAIRLGWVDLPSSSRSLLPQLARLREEMLAEGLDHVVLAGMGGSSLAPEVITAAAGAELTVLDTTDPGRMRLALADRLTTTMLVVASKSGTTTETDSHRRAYEQALRDAGLTADQIARRIVVVTDPGSPLEALARDAGYHVVLADPGVGGRYSALTAFGLVPSALAGVDVVRLLDDAAALAPALADDTANPGLLLGAALGAAAVAGRDKVVLTTTGGPLGGFPDWAEQLLAESTGKQGKGILPVVPGDADEPAAGDGDTVRVLVTGTGTGTGTNSGIGSADGTGIVTAGPLGAQFLLWEYATAVAGRVIGINPFDQPDVQETKTHTRRLLTTLEEGGELPEPEPMFADGPVLVLGEPDVAVGTTDLEGALRALLAAVPPHGYLAVMAYLDRLGDVTVPGVRPLLARALKDRQVTFGWGPRFLHSTGQYHKGGPANGAYLQITGACEADLPIPGRGFGFAQLQRAQAEGDLAALTGRGRPVLRLHLTDRQAGAARLLAAARAVAEETGA